MESTESVKNQRRAVIIGAAAISNYEKLAISLALLILSHSFAGAQPRLAKTAASLAVFRFSTVAPYLFPTKER